MLVYTRSNQLGFKNDIYIFDSAPHDFKYIDYCRLKN